MLVSDNVTDVIGLNAIPMAVPHTRPPSITAHGSDPDALGDLPRWGSAMKLPASAPRSGSARFRCQR